MQKISVVIPCYNSEHTIQKVALLTISEIEKMGFDYQLVLVNDGSRDATFQKIRELCLRDKKIIGIDLSKNFGQQNAIMAALNQADGDIILGMDDDMQTHPSQIHKLVEKLEEGHSIVYGKYPNRKSGFLKKLFSRINDLSLRILIGKPNTYRASSFWVCRKFVRDELVKYKYPFTHIQGLFLRTTSDIVNVDVEHFAREYGTSNYTFKKMLKLWSGCTNFSIVPLRAFTMLGLGTSLAGLIAAIAVAIRKIVSPHMAAGWPSLFCALLFFSGLILCGLGITGEYIGRIFMCINVSPQYVVREALNTEAGITAEELNV